MQRRSFLTAAAAGMVPATLAWSPARAADEYPSRPIQVIVPYAVGGADSYVRPLQPDLEKKYGIRRKHIAEPLRAMLAVLLQANGMKSDEITRYLEGDLKEQIIPCLGVTSRYAQITIGTEWGREMISQDLWANTWMRGVADGESVMNDSVRFPNEADVIRKLGGVVIMIKRPGTRPAKFKSRPTCRSASAAASRPSR